MDIACGDDAIIEFDFTNQDGSPFNANLRGQQGCDHHAGDHEDGQQIHQHRFYCGDRPEQGRPGP